MKRILIGLAALAAIGAAAFLGLTTPGLQRAGLEPVAAGAPDLDKGRIAFAAGGCASCHATPNQDDKTRLGGGYPLKSPFGTFYVPNLSPHPRDGIGGWTLAQFQRAMRGGVSPEGRHYYPSFPYTSYQRMTREDLRDLFGYILTLPAVEGRAPGHDLPFPFSVRRGLGLWKLAFLDGEPFRPDPTRPPSWNRGAYLVEGPGHCAECHSGRNPAGAIDPDRRFAGGPEPEGRGVVPNITPHETGIGRWSRSEVAELLATGFTPDFDSVGSSMAAVVKNTAQLPATDREAMAEYLLSLPPRPGPRGPK